jgi:hypothetical protein
MKWQHFFTKNEVIYLDQGIPVRLESCASNFVHYRREILHARLG